MRTLTNLQLKLAAGAIPLGILLGVFGLVRVGSVLIAAGTGVVALSHWSQENKRRRIIECYFPLAFAATLLVVALALPKGL